MPDTTGLKRLSDLIQDQGLEVVLSVLDTLPAPVTLSAEADNGLRYMNPAAMQMFEVEPDTVPATPPEELYAVARHRPVLAWMLKRAGYLKNIEIPFRRKHGGIITMLVNSRLLQMEDGQHLVLSIYADLTQRARRTEALQASELHYRTIFENNPTPQLLIDPKTNKVLEANTGAARFYGYTQAELTGMPVKRLTETDPVVLRQAFAAVMAGSQEPYHTQHKLADGSIRDVLIAPSRLRLTDGDCIYTIMQDVTEQRRYEQQLIAERRRYEALVEAQTDFICRYNPISYTFTYMNDPMMRFAGISPDEVKGTSMFNPDTDTAQMRADVKWRIDQLVQEGSRIEVVPSRLADGNIHWIQWSSTVIYGPDGTPDEVQSVGRDITELVNAEERLAEREARLRTMMDASVDGITTIDANGIIIDCNPAMYRLFGYPERLTGQPIAHLFGHQSNDALPQHMRWYLPDASYTPTRQEVNTYNENGDVSPMYLTVRRAELDSERLCFATFHDLSAIREAQRKIFLLQLERERAEILSGFMTQASHEFRTPLSVINSSAYMLSQISDQEQSRTHIKRIQDQSAHMTNLLESMLAMTRLDYASELSTITMDLNWLVKDVIASMRPDFQQKSVQVETKLAPELNIALEPREFSLALRNVIENALAFTPSGGTVTITTRQSDDSVEVVVKDTGAGMRDDELARAFDRFYRGDLAHTRRGFGLGLSITQRVMDLHRGTVKITSTPGEGTCVTLTVPLA
jgi:PAS domain S-box-containing protein